ncbi:MAG: hypothetical protein QOE47_268 [Pyrinomonadaceae bacterium]|jgi:hypothetical protein|nr:hypothetical protein [Pyrinomonadaceae bacterium]
MNRSILYRKRLVVLLSALLCAASLSASASEARAQELVVPMQAAPPPMVYIPREARTQLSAARDDKERTRLSLELAESRLARAEQQTELKQFNAATADLGVYQALMEDAIQYLYRAGDGGRSSRDLFKRLEQSLHRHTARVEAMRRATPGEFAGNVLALVRLLRDLRTEALEAFYSDTVVR